MGHFPGMGTHTSVRPTIHSSTPYTLCVFDRLGFFLLSRLGVTIQFPVPSFELRSPDR